MEDLPDLPLLLVVKLLPVVSLGRLSSTCWRMRDFVNDDGVWKVLFLRDWPGFPEPSNGMTWKARYRHAKQNTFAVAVGSNEGPSDWGVESAPPEGCDGGQLGTLTGFPGVIHSPIGIRQVACGGFHSLFVSYSGAVFACGSNGFGQLGLGDRVARKIPSLATSLSGRNVRLAACGYAFSVVVLESLSASSDELWSCGYAKNGRCGVSESDIAIHPSEDGHPLLLSWTKSMSLTHLLRTVAPLRWISLGSGHGAIVLHDGSVWTWGRNDCGQCGSASRRDECLPEFTVRVLSSAHSHIPERVTIAMMTSEGIAEVWCGSYHCIAVGNDRCQLWGWGSNVRGEAYPRVWTEEDQEEEKEAREEEANVDDRSEWIVPEPKKWRRFPDPVQTVQLLPNDTIIIRQSGTMFSNGVIRLSKPIRQVALPFAAITANGDLVFTTASGIVDPADARQIMSSKPISVKSSAEHCLMLFEKQ